MLRNISEERSMAKNIEFIMNSNRIAPKTSSEDIETLDFKEKSGRLIINPEYQRNFIQTQESASAYIESIFLGLIIPEIQIFEDYTTGNREIIDGQQRMLSLLKFYRGEYKLRKLKSLPELNNLYFKDLPVELQNIIRGFQVNIRIYTNEDDLYKYVIFERLNTGSKKLNAQEVRNCVYKGGLLQLTKEMALWQDIKDLLFGVKNLRFEREEAILNILSVMHLVKEDEGYEVLENDVMKNRINNYLELGKSFSEGDLNAIKENFTRVTKFIAKHFDMRNIAIKMYPDYPNFSVPKTLCESLYAIFNLYDLEYCEQFSDEIVYNIMEVFTSREFKDSLGVSQSKDLKSIYKRCSLVKNALENALSIGAHKRAEA